MGFLRLPAVCFLIGIAALGAGCRSTVPSDAGSEEVVRLTIRGTALLGQQKWGDAEAAFRSAAELAPSDPIPRNNIGVALLQQGRTEEARVEFEAALGLRPGFPYAHYNLGLVTKNDGRFEEAAAHFEAVAATDPDDLLTQYNIGVVLSRIDRGAEAEAAFRRALEREPTHVSTLYGLGRYLLQHGDAEEGARLVALSQQIRARSGLDEAVGSQYGEQGPYAMGVDYPGDALAAPAAVPVTFVATDEAATDGPVALTRTEDGGAVAIVADGDRVCVLGGACSEPAPGPIAALAAGDVDGDDGVETVALVAAAAGPLLAVLDDGAWTTRGSLPPEFAAAGAALTLVDRDHDGDLDAFACWPGPAAGCAIATNDAAGAFDTRPTSGAHGFTLPPGFRAPLAVAFSDVDNDRDVDLIAAGPDGVHVFSNERDATFADVGDAIGLGAAAGGATDLTVVDLTKDGFMDLVVSGPTGPRLLRSRLGEFEAPVTIGVGGGHVVVADVDNDGFLDLIVGREDATPVVHRNLGRGEWQSAAIEVTEAGAGAEPRAALDADGDGDLDLVTTLPGGATRLLRNDGGDANGWIAIGSVGVGDNRYGIGAKVEILAGALRQKFEVVDTVPLHAGLGSRTGVESVRYLWPGGVLQDEIEQGGNRLVAVEQLDRKGTSCPILYAWRDGRWHFVTDFLGGAAVGYRHANGVYSTPDTDEYVVIDGGLEADENDVVRVRLNNQLQEVIWFDQAHLLAVDHPAGTIVVPNERLAPGPPFPEFRLFVSGDVRPVAAARAVEDDRDVGAELLERDGVEVDGFASLPFKGYAEPHTLELDLGPFPRAARVILLLDGWIDYADSTSNLAAEQAGAALLPPALSFADGRGGFGPADARMGFPAGLTKTMTVDLTGRFPSDDHRVRIATTMRIYWDRARVMIGGNDIAPHVTRLAPLSAELRFGGFPRPLRPVGPTPRGYDPELVDEHGGFKAHAGPYTPYGDVRPSVATVDDRFVTTMRGDELEITFRAPARPAPGFVRTWLLHADGFGKDMDPNSAANDEVGPFPFHGMPTYPYPPGVVPPVEQDHGGRPPRIVPRAASGLHGAEPAPLARPAWPR